MIAETSIGVDGAAGGATQNTCGNDVVTVELATLQSALAVHPSAWQVPVDIPLGITQTLFLNTPERATVPGAPDPLQSWSETQGTVHWPLTHVESTSP